MQGIYAQLTGGVHLPSIYMHCTRSSSGCSGMQGIYAQLTVYWYSRHLCSIDRRGVDLPVGVLVCKASVLNWLGVHLPSMYMYCTRCSSGCSGMQGICAQLTGGVHLPSIYMHCTRSSSGCSRMQGICAQLTGGVHLPSIYMHCTRSSSGCNGMQGIYIQLTVYWYSRHLCSIDWGGLDLPVAVSVCKASVLIDW